MYSTHYEDIALEMISFWCASLRWKLHLGTTLVLRISPLLDNRLIPRFWVNARMSALRLEFTCSWGVESPLLDGSNVV